jgi:hypothetical protein
VHQLAHLLRLREQGRAVAQEVPHHEPAKLNPAQPEQVGSSQEVLLMWPWLADWWS